MTDLKMSVDGDITEFLQSSADSGTKVVLPKGIFLVGKTILLQDETHICGFGDQETTLVMASGVNNNMFTNAGFDKGNKNIRIENLRIEGNQAAQWKPDTERRLSFCNAVYLANVETSSFVHLHVHDMLQTALHFRGCNNVSIDQLHAERLGWSGISTSGTNNLIASKIAVINSGNDHRHSAVHLDGGNCNYVQGIINQCVGNGVMLDSTYARLTNCLVEIEARNCMRGVALIGGSENQTSGVCVKKSILVDNDIGIMVSNAHGAFVVDTHIEGSREFGVLFQGRVGGFDSFLANCRFERNAVDIKQIHQSRNNFFLSNDHGKSP